MQQFHPNFRHCVYVDLGIYLKTFREESSGYCFGKI